MQAKLTSYLVGGAVRDRLLKIEVKDRDYLVVGSTPAEMKAPGFKQVGADFPVFLHPTSHEEYALARTERKTGSGYHGFSVDFSPTVTLEEDLLRRDLTINAIAEAVDGTLFDPYNGAADLIDKKLRHVSPAFREDPVRILRTARFAARFHKLGFSIADETCTLMREMVAQGEADHLVPERIWQEWKRALEGPDSSTFIKVLKTVGALAVVAPELDALYEQPSPTQYRNGLQHLGQLAEQALQRACILTNRGEIRFAALLTALGSPVLNEPLHALKPSQPSPLKQLCDRLSVPNSWHDLARLVSNHFQRADLVEKADPEELLSLLESLDAFRREQRFEFFLLACQAVAGGGVDALDHPYQPAVLLKRALAQTKPITVQPLLQQGLKGVAIQRGLRNLRLQALQQR
ncbi:MAG: multifunctional CCA addition/repair protein [Immundisolibacteraceae bacterium]|nr:multifunctional CCA addition/repair protein [Immundisolibacteraceae bacterium]